MISDDLNLPDFCVARIVPFYMIPYGVGALIYAYLTRYFTYRRVLISAMSVYAGFCLWTAVSTQLGFMLIA